MKDVHAKVATWSRLHAVQKEYEFRVGQAKERHGAGNDPVRVQLEAEMKAVVAQVDKAFREASDAVHGKRGKDRPSAT
ncbi:MAG: hypothetical protein ABI409_06675 [Ramlibacter sp.]